MQLLLRLYRLFVKPQAPSLELRLVLSALDGNETWYTKEYYTFSESLSSEIHATCGDITLHINHRVEMHRPVYHRFNRAESKIIKQKFDRLAELDYQKTLQRHLDKQMKLLSDNNSTTISYGT